MKAVLYRGAVETASHYPEDEGQVGESAGYQLHVCLTHRGKSPQQSHTHTQEAQYRKKISHALPASVEYVIYVYIISTSHVYLC